MSLSGFRRFSQDQGAAVAPTVALALFALIGMGGLAFDFARMANLDTELQTAADQAALAAASQLDGIAGARARATSAANALISNPTRFANDGDTAAVGIASVTYYVDKAGTTVATSDTDANFVDVTVETRTANFALTPIVDAISADMSASAFAGVGSAICGVVPFFICNPTEPSDNDDNYYPVGVETGVGIVMAEGGTSWGPGNFGFLEQLGTGANNAAEALASNALFGSCSATETATTQTGNILNAVRDSLNMRFDYAAANNATCKSPPCSPSNNSIKDLVRPSNNCSWQENPATLANYQSKRYRPNSNAALDSSITPEIMGHPRDMCHAYSATTYACAYGRIGDGMWDRAAYFRSNHPGVNWQTETGLGPNVTRYQTYLWEAADASRRGSKSVGTLASYGTPQAGRCAAPGLDPDPAGIDRRRITAAVVNCGSVDKSIGLNGKKTIPVAGFIDVFLVEPSLKRTRCSAKDKDCDDVYTTANDIYVEAIGAAGSGEGGSVAQISRRDVPRLIR
ncbi:pilus assembly protein TadG-related protein [Sphingorhabdus pulchriflava]|nr:pilus assembly protein TadG-related protein [Sphingorhabdus pulchriflava]